MTDKNTESRAAFEAWAVEEGLHIDRNKYGCEERYASISTQSAFRGWQAKSRAQAVNGKGWGGSGTSMIDGHDVAAPVQMPEPISTVLEDCRSRAIDYATCPSPYNRTRMDTAFQLLDHQVRQLLAAHGIGKDKA